MNYYLVLCLFFSPLIAEEIVKEKNMVPHTTQEAITYVIDKDILTKCLEVFHKSFDNQFALKFSTKIDGSLVSDLELEIEKNISAYLKEATPWASFLGEEGVQHDASDKTLGFGWFLDPIDGTISFSNGLDTFAFTLTLAHHSEAIATVIYFPRLGKTYQAVKGRGATLNGKPIHMSGAIHGPKSVFAVSDDYTFQMTQRHEVLIHLRKMPCIVRTVTDIFGYCMVAEGKCVGKFDAAGALWDLSPGYLLIKEAGGKCLYFPMPNPTDDLAGSMLIGKSTFVDEVYQYLKENVDVKTLPVPSESL